MVTANDQFGLIISLVFEICQLRHHANNWIELPKSIDRNIDTLFHNINLPRPNDDLTSQKIVLKNLLKHDLQETAQSHIQSQLDRALGKIKLINPTDKDKCTNIVRNKLMREIPRMNRVSLDQWIDECINVVGTHYTQVGTNGTQSDKTYSEAVKQNRTVNTQHTCNLSNNQRTRLDTLDDITLPKHPHTSFKRKLPVSPPIQTSNRFDALRGLVTESPMKARKLTVDDARRAPQVSRKLHVSQQNGKVSGTSIEMSATAEADASAAGGVDSFVEVTRTPLTGAKDAEGTGVTGLTASTAAVAAAELCRAATPAGTEVTDATDTATAVEPCKAEGASTGTEAPGATGVTDAAAAGTEVTAVTETETGTAAGLDAVAAATDAEATGTMNVTETTTTTEDDAGVEGATTTTGTGDVASTRMGLTAAAPEDRLWTSQGNRRSSGSWSLTRAQSQPTLDGLFHFGKISGTGRAGAVKTGNKFVHDNWDKHSHILRVQTKATNVMITDSNFRHWQPNNDNFEVHVFPGANFTHAYKLIQTAMIPDSVLNFIICVGINHRSWEFSVSTEPEFRKLLVATKTLKQRVYFLGVSAPPNLAPSESDNITRLNNSARSKFGTRFFIPPLPRDQIRIRPEDQIFKIHHDEDTVKRVFSSIVNHVSAVPLN